MTGTVYWIGNWRNEWTRHRCPLGRRPTAHAPAWRPFRVVGSAGIERTAERLSAAHYGSQRQVWRGSGMHVNGPEGRLSTVLPGTMQMLPGGMSSGLSSAGLWMTSGDRDHWYPSVPWKARAIHNRAV